MRSLSFLALLLSACAVAPTTTTTAPAAAASTTTPPAGHHGGSIDYRPWEKASFDKAAAEQRLLLVTVVTEWCHWCHVMDEKTWGDPAIAALVAERFVVVRVDADARPDLAERYADWGWPALALLTPDAQPVTEWKGYVEARRFERELKGYLKDLDAGRPLARKAPVVDDTPAPLAHIRDFTRAQLDRYYDVEQGGWGKPQKYPMWAPVAHALFVSATDGDTAALARAKQTLDGELQLIDGVDGGMYQYSLESVWTAPHYEKLAEINGLALENLADAYTATGDPRYLQGARDLARFALTILRRDDGAFFANQDADVGTRGEHGKVLGKQYYGLSLAERRKAGTPFIDRHVYASHNGRLAAGLARLAAVTGEAPFKDAAVAAVDVVLARHRVGDGFSHDEGTADDAVLHLADQVAVGQALVLLGEVTGLPRYREEARKTARFMVASLMDTTKGGFYAHTATNDDVGVFAERRKPFKHNGEAARLLLKIGRLEEDDALVAAGEQALGAFASEGLVKEEYKAVGEVLLALEEQLREPLRFSVVGGDDAATKALLASSLKVWAPHRLVDVQAPGKKYPDQGKPALYICGKTYCSPPITDPAKVSEKAARYLKKPS
ncbi:MAG: DUF255 domain-containing protein [Deltaproteobacteria bacterium]|nr:DUF255 domain-containing protein [Deltaproteobacteria bacterium]